MPAKSPLRLLRTLQGPCLSAETAERWSQSRILSRAGFPPERSVKAGAGQPPPEGQEEGARSELMLLCDI